MKILHVSHLYYPSIGGNQFHTQLMSEKLAQLNEDVTVFTSRAVHMGHFLFPDKDSKKLPEKETINGVKVQRFNVNNKVRAFLFQHDIQIKIRGVYRLFKILAGDTRGYWEHGPVTLGMLNAMRRLKPDIIVATNNYFFTTYLCYLAKKFFHIPLIFMPIIHIADPWTFHPFTKVIYETSDLIIACTEFEKNHLICQGVKAAKIKVLPLGIDPNMFAGANDIKIRQKYQLKDGPIIAYLGRKVPHKGIETLIDSMGLVWKEFPSAQLLLAGQTAEYFVPKIQQHIDQYSTEERRRIINIDNFEEEEKKDFYDAIDILAMPSNTDCFGMVYLEAWASGKPVIACKNTPQETIIRNGVDGLLVEYHSKTQLADAIQTLLADDKLRLEMGHNGKNIVNTKYHVDLYGEGLRRTYHQLSCGGTGVIQQEQSIVK